MINRCAQAIQHCETAGTTPIWWQQTLLFLATAALIGAVCLALFLSHEARQIRQHGHPPLTHTKRASTRNPHWNVRNQHANVRTTPKTTKAPTRNPPGKKIGA